jgi:predicted transcriptional regulator
MNKITKYLDLMKEKTGSDYQTAKELGITKSAVSKMRKNKRLDDVNAIKIAEFLEIEPEEILLAATIARSKGETKKAWEKISQLAGIINYSILTGTLINPTLSMIKIELAKAGICILCKIKKPLITSVKLFKFLEKIQHDKNKPIKT